MKTINYDNNCYCQDQICLILDDMTHTCKILFACLLLTSFSPVKNESAFPPLQMHLNLVAKGFTSPVGMASPRDGTNRLFVFEQGGRIKLVRDGQQNERPFLDVSRKLDGLNIAYSEKGLLGLAFHPAYKSNGRFFVYYSAPYSASGFDHKSILAEYK